MASTNGTHGKFAYLYSTVIISIRVYGRGVMLNCTGILTRISQSSIVSILYLMYTNSKP